MADQFLLEEEKEFKRYYRLSLWWVEHREPLRRLLLGIALCIEGVIIAAAIWTFVDSFLVSGEAERAATARMVAVGRELSGYSQTTAAQNLEVSAVSVLSAGEGKYDFAATVTNPNEDWWATFTYVFRAGDLVTEPAKGFILPGQERPFVVLATPSGSVPRAAELEFSDFTWERVDKHLTGSYETFARDRLNIVVTNPVFTDLQIDEKTIGRVSFTAENRTAFSYYDPQFVILLRRGGGIVGMNATTLSSIEAGLRPEVVVNWFGPLPAASEVQVFPIVNIFDENVYKPLPGESTDDVRGRAFENR